MSSLATSPAWKDNTPGMLSHKRAPWCSVPQTTVMTSNATAATPAAYFRRESALISSIRKYIPTIVALPSSTHIICLVANNKSIRDKTTTLTVANMATNGRSSRSRWLDTRSSSSAAASTAPGTAAARTARPGGSPLRISISSRPTVPITTARAIKTISVRCPGCMDSHSFNNWYDGSPARRTFGQVVRQAHYKRDACPTEKYRGSGEYCHPGDEVGLSA